MEIRDLTASDGDALRSFRCATGDPWEKSVQAGIREDLGAALTHGTFLAMGAWINGDLAGVLAWREYGGPNAWWLDLLASSLAHRTEGAAQALYVKLIERALDEQVRLICSRVDRQGIAMIGLQKKVGAVGEVDPNNVDRLLYALAIPAQEIDVEP